MVSSGTHTMPSRHGRDETSDASAPRAFVQHLVYVAVTGSYAEWKTWLEIIFLRGDDRMRGNLW